MIWSTSLPEAKKTAQLLESVGALRTSSPIHAWLSKAAHSEDLQPVRYVVATQVAKLVTPYAFLNQDGFLEGGDGIYSVYSSVQHQKYYAKDAKSAITEAHALAERTALTRGIFTPSGRASSEAIIAEGIPLHFRQHYLGERLGYLAVLQSEAAIDPSLSQLEKRCLDQELELGKTELAKFLLHD